jgi:hypothetical protein
MSMAVYPSQKPRPDLLAAAIAKKPAAGPAPENKTYTAAPSPGLKIGIPTDKQALNAKLIGAMVGSGQLSAGQVQANAKAAGVDLGSAFGSNAVAGVYQPVQTATKPAAPAPAAQPAPAPAPTPVAPQATAYHYSGPLTNPGAEAQARAGINANYQNAALQQSLARRLAQLKQGEQGIEQQRARGALEATEAANASGFATSGRNFALNGQVNAEAVRQQGALEDQRNLAVTEAGDQLGRIAREQGMNEVSLLGELSRDQRDYGLREALANADLAQSAFSLSRGQQMLPYELQGAQLNLDQGQFNLGRDRQMLGGQLTAQQLANAIAQQSLRTGDAQFNENYSPTGLGYQSKEQALISAILANQTGQAQYADQYGGGIGQQSREQALRGQTIANEVAEIDKGIKVLELQIAQNPDYGSAAQAREQLAQLQAARQAKLQEIGSGGLTAAQQYNQLQDRKQEITGTYKVSNAAAETWIDFQDAVGDLLAGGLSPTQTEQAAGALAEMMKGRALSDTDRKFLYTSLYKAIGQRAPQYPDLETFRKDYKAPPQIDPITGQPVPGT